MTTFILIHKERTQSPIAILISFRGKKYKKGIGESVLTKLWNPAKKRVRVSAGNTEATDINDRLELWEEAARKTISYFKEKTYVPDQNEFLKVLEEQRFGEKDNEKRRDILLLDYFGAFIERYDGIRSENRMKQYRLVRNVISRYEEASRKHLKFEDITQDFYNRFSKWFYGCGYSTNYFGAVIQVLKVVMGEAMKEDHLHNNAAFEGKNFTAPQIESDSIYLTVDELTRMHRLTIDTRLIASEYPEINKSKLGPRARAYEKARDMFLIGAFTGLRFSDFSRLEWKNITNTGTISIQTQKTGTKVVIPIHPVVREILDRGYDFSSSMSDQKINRYIKEVGKIAGIDGMVTINRNVGGRTVTESVPKYSLITTHTARRSFATNAYKSGVPTIAIMKITGHREESTFLRYIKVSEEENAEMLKRHSFFQYNGEPNGVP